MGISILALMKPLKKRGEPSRHVSVGTVTLRRSKLCQSGGPFRSRGGQEDSCASLRAAKRMELHRKVRLAIRPFSLSRSGSFATLVAESSVCRFSCQDALSLGAPWGGHVCQKTLRRSVRVQACEEPWLHRRHQAYRTLLETTRRTVLVGTALARMQCRTIRLRLLKTAAVLTRNSRIVRVRYSSVCPDQAPF